MYGKEKKNIKINKIAHNRKSDCTEKAFAFFNIFTCNFQNRCIIALVPYLLARIFKLGFF